MELRRVLFRSNKDKKQMFNSVLQPLVQKLFDLGATPVEITELLEDNLADLGIGIKIAAEAIDEDKAKFLNDVTNLIELRIEDTNELVAGIMFSKTQGVRLGNVDEEFFDANPEYKNHFTTLLRTLESVYRKRGVTDSKDIVPAISVILEKLKSEGRLNHNFKLDILK